ncbi:MAG: hypothetical protein OXE79_06975 [Acidimicrobiaceae bacterium]|nr:hypothetical protein [Acidimicrobiaceae bacterium]MCY4174872.1 hypothetical protein [Acidimicrobiaceae bacterium]MCY4281123.1 hypothetical protein [Acidimicrobiaceae bacterium]MCY4294416.1 hypothetical protein [Acidimicrobiaceae bacterium]
MIAHHNWFFRDGDPLEGGPLVIFDLDGVISDASHRQHFMRGERKDFRGFFTAAVDDPPLPVGRALAASVTDDHAVAILTARPFYVVDGTRDWLSANDVRHDLLILRPRWGRFRSSPSADFKRSELQRLREAGYEVKVALDDDERVVDMYRSEGVFALYVHSGYYDR